MYGKLSLELKSWLQFKYFPLPKGSATTVNALETSNSSAIADHYWSIKVNIQCGYKLRRNHVSMVDVLNCHLHLSLFIFLPYSIYLDKWWNLVYWTIYFSVLQSEKKSTLVVVLMPWSCGCMTTCFLLQA